MNFVTNCVVLVMEKKIKILILEDSEDDFQLMHHQLQKEGMLFETERVDTREEFTEAIQRFRPDVILSDHGLPQFNSNEALKITIKEKLDAPFILVTGTVSEEFAVASLRNGAHDYILKSNLSRLPTAIYRALKEKKQERLKQEAQDALKEQNEELIKANNELDRFVYSVSHNLRGPLASVMGLLNIAGMEDRSKKLTSIHDMMNISMQKLDETLKEIVDYSHNSRKKILVQEINWPELILNTLKKLEYLHPGEVITTSLNIESENPFYSDYNRLEVIFNNLLSNAILYRTKSSTLVLNIKIVNNNKEAHLTINDNGIGIETTSLARIFEMFYRGTNRSKGAGLGLYITKEIIHKLKGSIEINSVYGGGTTVKITLPSILATAQKD